MAKANKGVKLAKASLAKTNTLEVNITGDYEADRQKFQAMATALGFTFNSSNQVVDEQIVDDVALLISKVNSLATMLSSSFDGNGDILVDGYATHTHTETGTETQGVS